MAKKTGLGKGLDSLIPVHNNTEKEKAVVEKVVEKKTDTVLRITEIEPNKGQPRKNFNEDALEELADSIKQFGLIQPLVVQKRDGYYEIIAGERRWRAAKKAGLKEVPVIIRDYTDEEMMEIALIENLQREDLNPIEEAQAYKKLINDYKLKQDEIAEKVSKSRVAITNSMRLLKLSEKVQDMIVDEMISSGHGRALLALNDKKRLEELANRIFDEKLSVRETEQIVKALNNPKEKKQKEEEKKKEEEEQKELLKKYEEQEAQEAEAAKKAEEEKKAQEAASNSQSASTSSSSSTGSSTDNSLYSSWSEKLVGAEQSDTAILNEVGASDDFNTKMAKEEARYQLWDGLLNQMWQDLKASLPEDQMSQLTSAQVDWIHQKEAMISQYWESQNVDHSGFNEAPAADTTKQRVYYLLDYCPRSN